MRRTLTSCAALLVSALAIAGSAAAAPSKTQPDCHGVIDAGLAHAYGSPAAYANLVGISVAQLQAFLKGACDF